MPAMLTHDQFGQDAYGMALEVTDLFTPDERDAFLLGNQGPDPLFYLLLLPPLDEFRVWGSRMHNERPSAVFCAMRQAVDGLPAEERKVGRAYLAGFTCHYLLDRAIHPLVYFWERGICQAGVSDLDSSDGNIVHAEIERDLDEMVLFAKRNQTIKSYRPYEQVLRGRDQMLAVWETCIAIRQSVRLRRTNPRLTRCIRWRCTASVWRSACFGRRVGVRRTFLLALRLR